MTCWYLFIEKGESKCVTVSHGGKWRVLQVWTDNRFFNEEAPKLDEVSERISADIPNIMRQLIGRVVAAWRAKTKKKKKSVKYVRAEMAERGRETENVLGSYGSLWRTVVGGGGGHIWRGVENLMQTSSAFSQVTSHDSQHTVLFLFNFFDS